METLETKTNTPARTKGSGLIFAVVLLFVILGMVITLSSLTILETKMSQKTKSSIGAFYNSEAGVEWALNKIATSNSDKYLNSIGLTYKSDGSVTCPISPDCNVFFLDKEGKVIDDSLIATTKVGDIKAVRSVGTQGTGGAADTQRAIEAAVAGTSTCSGIPTEIDSSDQGSGIILRDAVTACRSRGSCWHLPSQEELTLFMAPSIGKTLWTRTLDLTHTWSQYVTLTPNSGAWMTMSSGSSDVNVWYRCVR